MFTALVVENDSNVAMLMAALLKRKYGTETVVLESGVEAVAWARSHRPDLILLDLNLPDLSGVAVCRAMRFSAYTNKIPIIMFMKFPSAYLYCGEGCETAQDVADRSGADRLLVPPYSLDEFFEAVEGALARRREGRTAGDRVPPHDPGSL